MNLKPQASSLKLPVLIVGGGLAGMTLAWRLWERGVRFVLVDPEHPETCSKIAAGLITPVTGMRLNVSWRMEELLRSASLFYANVGSKLRSKFHHTVPHVRLLKSAREASLWQDRRRDADVQRWLDPRAPDPLVDASIFHDEVGGFQQRESGWLDTAAYLRHSQEFFAENGCWQRGEVADGDLVETTEQVCWQGERFSAAVFCRGAEERKAVRFFPWLQWDCARGVIARLQADIAESRIINRGCWLLPREGAWRAGSTYDFDFEAPLEASVERLEEKLHGLLKVPFELTGAQAGIRPILKRRQLALGRHPAHPRILIFNGLGSKGALRAPFFSNQLVEHLLDAAAIEESVDVAANG